ncbi:MAG: hypothetical protein OER95_08770, partial [Acidimicrobiia bacterium]|nr:hypothetical protein [Acidimicrobiia bacterium]
GTNSQTCGLRQGGWWGYAQPGQLPADQRLEEPAAFRFVGSPVTGSMSVVGVPRVRLTVSANAPRALVAVRLCDVAPDGSSLQLSRGVLNLCHRAGHEFPEAVVPGEPMAVEVVLDGVAHELAAGHRMELLVGTTLWPLVWPSPTNITLTLHLDEGCTLLLPVRHRTVADDDVDPFGPPETAEPGSAPVSNGDQTRTITEDLGRGTTTLVDHFDSGGIEFAENDDVMFVAATDTWIINRHDPLSARVISRRTWSIRWSDHPDICQVEATAEMWADSQWFYTTNTVTVLEGETELSTRSHNRRYPRNHV